MFDKIIHADWSTAANKKWMAIAERIDGNWTLGAPRLVPTSEDFLDHWLFDGGKVLAGFDFPIGVPISYGAATGLKGFREFLTELGEGSWSDFFKVADAPEDVSFRRPFYPRTSIKGRKQSDLLRGLGVESIDKLRRACERKTEIRRAACVLFWTLGGNQVGKAAIDGWRTVLQPAISRGARLWPFEGALAELAVAEGCCVICETYPQEAYSHAGVRFRPNGSKRVQKDRLEATRTTVDWCAEHRIVLQASAREQLLDGFGLSSSGEDAFDAFVGLLGMIEVVERRRNEGRPWTTAQEQWEGWILGQQQLE